MRALKEAPRGAERAFVESEIARELREAARSPGERRCPTCGGLAAGDAEWCGQCFSPLRGEDPSEDRPRSNAPVTVPRASTAAAMATPGGGTLEVADGRARWDCPVCGERNAIEASACGACGTPFGRLFERPEPRPKIDPRRAAIWSLALPGLGHWKAGHRADGVARFVLFGWTFCTVIVILLSRWGRGFGSFLPLLVLYLGATASVYVLSAVDAERLAGGDAPAVSSRALLWASAALVLGSIVLASFVVLPAARG